MSDLARFELVNEFADQADLLPTRATENSAGYDFVVARDIVVPSYKKMFSAWSKDLSIDMIMEIANQLSPGEDPYVGLQYAAKLTEKYNARPTLVPTGVKAYLPEGTFLQLSVRSSCPLKHWLILANGVGIIDADYYNNESNEGHIFFQMINLFQYDITLHRGDKIGQGIILPYYLAEGDAAAATRTGGFGSTSE